MSPCKEYRKSACEKGTHRANENQNLLIKTVTRKINSAADLNSVKIKLVLEILHLKEWNC